MRRIRRSDAARQEKLDRRLYKAASTGDVQQVKLCLADGARMVSPGSVGTPLHATAMYGHLGVTLLLLEAGAPSNILGDSNYSPLHLAARYNHSHIAVALINFGADLNVASKFEKRSPLHIAVKWGREQLTELLVTKGARVDCRDLYGNTPLQLACQAGNLALVTELLAHSADPDLFDNDGWSAMHFAASEAQDEIVQLLSTHKSPIDQQNKHGRTPLHWACVRNHVSTVEVLLALGASPTIKDRMDKCAKDVTSSGPIQRIIKLYEANLKEDGVDHGVTTLDLQMTLKPFLRQVTRLDQQDTRSVTSSDSSVSPEVARCLTAVFGSDILRQLNECFGPSSGVAEVEREHARHKYKQCLMAVGTLLTVTSQQVDTLYTTVSSSLNNRSQTQIVDVLKVIFERLQSLEDNLADFQREIRAIVRALTANLKEVLDKCTQDSPELATEAASLQSRRVVFEQGHFLGKVAHCLSKHHDCWRLLVPKLNPHLTPKNTAEFIDRIAGRSPHEMDRISSVLFSWQFFRGDAPLDTQLLLKVAGELSIENLQDEVLKLVDEYFNFTPLIHFAETCIDDPALKSDGDMLNDRTDQNDNYTDC